MSKLEVAFLVGAESKQWLAEFKSALETLKELITEVRDSGEKVLAAGKSTANGKANSKVSAAAEQEEFDLDTSDTEDDEPAITKKDLIEACRANREAAVKVLKKLKVKSVHDLKPTQYETVMSALGA